MKSQKRMTTLTLQFYSNSYFFTEQWKYCPYQRSEGWVSRASSRNFSKNSATTLRKRPNTINPPEQRHSAPEDLIMTPSPVREFSEHLMPLSDIDRSFALDPEFSFLLSLPATFFDQGKSSFAHKTSPSSSCESPQQSPFSPYHVLPSIDDAFSGHDDHKTGSIRRSANFHQARAQYERLGSHDIVTSLQSPPCSGDQSDVTSTSTANMLDTIWEDKVLLCLWRHVV